MITANFTADIEHITCDEHLYQWDNGQKLSISGVGVADIHFANKKSEKALVITPAVSSGACIASIPNSLLTEPYPIIAYVYVPSDNGSRTIKTVTIYVEPRKQPIEYTALPDDEKITLQSISTRASYVLNEVSNSVNTAVSNMNSDYATFKEQIRSDLMDMKNEATIPNADTVDGLHANEIASNDNLIINSNFKINQGGKTEYTAIGNSVDMWKITKASLSKITVSDSGIKCLRTGETASDYAMLTQNVLYKASPTGSYTLSAKIKASNVTSGYFAILVRLGDANDGYLSRAVIQVNASGMIGIYTATLTIPQNAVTLRIEISSYGTNVNDYVEIEWIKLEHSKVATSFIPPNTVEELLIIQANDGTIPANTANKSGTLATTASNVCLRNMSTGTAEANTTNCPTGAWYGQYE